MGTWKGLDPGGTEQLWDPDVLVDVTAIFRAHDPFSRGNETDPIYLDLESQYPDITWRNTDASGFREIFRKANPWVKLGLTTEGRQNASVTPLGEELLAGIKDIKDIFVEATKSHQEADGTYSFALMCRAALERPEEKFSLEDVEYGVSLGYADGTTSLIDAITKVRSTGQTFPHGSRRIRTLRSFMNALVSSGALVHTDKGWMLGDKIQAAEIAQVDLTTLNSAPASSVVIPQASLPKSKRTPDSGIYEIARGKRSVAPFAPGSGKHDPVKRALLLEKANSLHELLVEKCANEIRSAGGTPFENQNSFDVAEKNFGILIEVKSVTEFNSVSQARKAVAQLLEYRYMHREMFTAEKVDLYLVTNENLANYVEEKFIEFLEQELSIQLFWLSGESLIDSQGNTLLSVITHRQ